MPRAATVERDPALEADAVAERTRRPGDFARHPETGAPYVAHPTEHTKNGWPGNKAQLIALCAERGIAADVTMRVDAIRALLGPKPCRVQYGRPSGLGKQIENTTNLQKWAERAVALGLYLALIEDGDDAAG